MPRMILREVAITPRAMPIMMALWPAVLGQAMIQLARVGMCKNSSCFGNQKVK